MINEYQGKEKQKKSSQGTRPSIRRANSTTNKGAFMTTNNKFT